MSVPQITYITPNLSNIALKQECSVTAHIERVGHATPQHPCANLTGFRLTFDLPIETRGGGREMTDG